MLFLTYLGRELRHRSRQAIIIGTGLALGVALVITVGAASAGVTAAQASVLRSLYGVGTDMTVTRAWSQSAGGQQHIVDPKPTAQDLDFLGDDSQGLFSASAAATVAKLPHVAAAVSVLALLDTKMHVPAQPTGGPSAQGGSGSGDTALQLPTTINVDGVDTVHRGLGPLSQASLTSGRGLADSDANADVALVDANYAKAHKLTVGSTVILAKKAFRVVGIVSQPVGSSPDVLIPLARAQALSGLTGQVNQVAVAADSAANVAAVSREISRALPSWANVTTSSNLASGISGSLAGAARLAGDLGRWVAAAALAAAFALAGLLTMAAVSRRVREFGTLKALGWRAGRIVGQVLGESVTVSLAGAVVGVGLGFGGAALVSSLAPTLTATVAAAPGTTEPQGVLMQDKAGSGAPQTQHFTAPGSYHSVPIHFSAPVSLGVVLLAVALGIAGGLLAGALGGWRAARLRPSAALAKVG